MQILYIAPNIMIISLILVHEQAVKAIDNAVVIYEPSNRQRIRQNIRSNDSIVDLGAVLDDLLHKLQWTPLHFHHQNLPIYFQTLL